MKPSKDIFRKTLDVRFELKDLSDTGTFTGYGSVFGNVDLGNDVVERGAFKEVELTKDGQVRVLYQHSMREPVGKARIAQDDIGLKLDGHLVLGMSRARDCYEGMKAGILDGLSIGYDVLPDGSRDGEDGVRHLTGLKLWEVSIVTFGMNRLARVDSVKDALRALEVKTRRDFEDLLREIGFTSNQAKSIASRGWKQDPPSGQLRDAGDAVRETAAIIRKIGAEPRDAAVSNLLKALDGLRL